MHPVIIISFALVLRVLSVAFPQRSASSGLGLAGASSTSWQFLPAFVLLYFAFAPKPRASAWRYVAVSGLFFVVGSSALIAELYRYPEEAPMVRYGEFTLLALSLLLHVVYANWKEREDEWGRWQLV